MTDDQLTGILAERVMGWTVGPDRFSRGNREWMPRWKFQPFENYPAFVEYPGSTTLRLETARDMFVKIEDAFRLLDQAAPQEYSICGDEKGNIHVRVRVDSTAGEARGRSKPSAITYAVGRAVGIGVEP